MKKSETKKTFRCAIYTRKSIAEGLDMDFNTLDAQREAGENYVASQKAEGWSVISKHYDDGGFSGGNMDRPALKELFEDIKNGEIDIVIVYKVDRLSRSIMDFAKIVELFEAHNVSFVSVTQHFNTKDSMGRLTLNILLSFAQFEREIISERIRDKITASKKRGQWIGGLPILGFDINYGGRGVVINEVEAQTVREIFDIYIEMQSMSKTVEILNDRGIFNKQWRTRKGKMRGGERFSKSTLARLLNNKKYIGKVDFKGEVYDGDFGSIVSEEVFNKANEIIKANNFEKVRPQKNKYNSLLLGKLYCAHCGTPMGPHYSKKSPNKIYRYYVCSHAQKYGWTKCPHPSLPAVEIENYLVREIAEIASSGKLRKEIVDEFYSGALQEISELENRNKTLSKALNDVLRKIESEKQRPTNPYFLSDLQEQVEKINESIEYNKSQILRNTQNANLRRDKLDNILQNFNLVWENLTWKDKKDMFDILIDKVIYKGDEGKISITFSETFKGILK